MEKKQTVTFSREVTRAQAAQLRAFADLLQLADNPPKGSDETDRNDLEMLSNVAETVVGISRKHVGEMRRKAA